MINHGFDWCGKHVDVVTNKRLKIWKTHVKEAEREKLSLVF